MKKLIAIGIAVLMVLGLSALAHADIIQTQKDITVDITVDSAFGMEIWDTEFAQDLGSVAPGIGNTGEVHFYATSNHSIPWTIQAASAGVIGQTQGTPDTLPIEFTTIDGGAGLTGTLVSDVVLSAVAAPIYTCGASEYPVSGLMIDGIFAVNSLLTTKEDTYSGTLTLTMTE